MTDEVLKELDPAALLKDLPAHGLVVGDVGTVVFVYHGGEAYEVEFMDADGRTLVVATLQADQVAPLRGRQILHVRPLTAAQVGLSRAALEALAIVAYRQPIARSGIELIRGTASDSALDTLLDRSSDPDRTHDVRSVLYRLRAKLRDSAWAIPIPPHGQGVRLVRGDIAALAA